MKPGSLVGDIKNILVNELKMRIAGGIVSAVGGESLMHSTDGGSMMHPGGGGAMMNPAGGGSMMHSGAGGTMGALLGAGMGRLFGGHAGGAMNTISYSMPGARFQDFLEGGMKMHATIAIDFTPWNMPQDMPNSLHFMNPQSLNNYEEALASVVGTIEACDWDQRFQVFGFGARYPRSNPMIRYDFNLNHDNSECMGVQDVLDAYRRCLNDIQFGEPTQFAPIIQKVIHSIRPFDQDNYYLLLILTAGQITDIQMTESVIAQAASLPLSIMIVGIGNGPFEYMVRLDNDVRHGLKKNRKEQKLQSGYYQMGHTGKPKKGKKNKMMGAGGLGMMDPTMGGSGMMSSMGGMNTMGMIGGINRKHRDIVQFVAFNVFHTYGDDNVARVAFAQELMAELPFQFESYMRMYNYMPRPRNPNRPSHITCTPSAGIGAGMMGAGMGATYGPGPGHTPMTSAYGPGQTTMTSAYGQGQPPMVSAYGQGQTAMGNYGSPMNPPFGYASTVPSSYTGNVSAYSAMPSTQLSLQQQGLYPGSSIFLGQLSTNPSLHQSSQTYNPNVVGNVSQLPQGNAAFGSLLPYSIPNNNNAQSQYQTTLNYPHQPY